MAKIPNLVPSSTMDVHNGILRNPTATRGYFRECKGSGCLTHRKEVSLEKFLKFYFHLKHPKMATPEGGKGGCKCPCPQVIVSFYFQKYSFIPIIAISFSRIALLFSKSVLLFSRSVLLFPETALLFSRSAFYFSKNSLLFSRIAL